MQPTNDLWTRVKEQGTPLIEEDTATFVWFGKKAPLLAGDFSNWGGGEPITLTQTAENVWVYQAHFPSDAYLEYAYFDQDGERLPDPFNANTVPSGVGDRNHYFYMPAGAPSKLARRRPNVDHGRVEQHTIESKRLIVGGKRDIYLYQPPAVGPVPLVVVWDGRDYLHRVHLTHIVDNLIAQERIRPIALAMVRNGGSARFIEYACSEATLGFLITHVLPLAQERLDLIDIKKTPGAFGVLGASMGGLMALYSAVRLAHIFGSAISQSGAFSLGGYDPVLSELIRLCEPKPIRIWMDVGIYDFTINANQRMRDLLAARGYDVTYREYNAGHNYPAWRDEIWRGLEHLYGNK